MVCAFNPLYWTGAYCIGQGAAGQLLAAAGVPQPGPTWAPTLTS